MKKTLIFSDVHLKAGGNGEPQRREFTAFLRQASPDEYGRVICLGDLFDFWFEYRHCIFSAFFQPLRAFAELREAGTELHLISGNHDFWAGRFLEKELGFHIHRDGCLLPFGQEQGFLIHGDGINPRDWSYRLYKRVARHPLVVGAFRQLHPDWAMRLAMGVSHGSRTWLGVEDTAEGPEAKALKDFARQALAEGKARYILCGHSHAPTIEEYPTPEGTGLYINPGDWLERRAYATWDAGHFQLHRAPGPAGTPHAPALSPK